MWSTPLWKTRIPAFITDTSFTSPFVFVSNRNHLVHRRYLLQTTPLNPSKLTMSQQTKTLIDRPKSMKYDAVLDFLLQKNQQFQRGVETGAILENESQPEYRQSLAHGGQKPIATIVTCCDSRVIPEVIFQQGFGKLFTVRTAGSLVSSPTVLGSIQFGVENFTTPLLMVMGHTECGAAITGWNMCHHEKHRIQQLSPALQSLIRPMEPLVEEIQSRYNNISISEASQHLAEAIAKDAVKTILKELPSLNQLQASHQLGIVSALYDLHQGNVVVLEKSWK
ncbi:Carbonic anhydrase 2 [Galdieria sulphuraria]|nr:Carbonic anhydrase 2 [Galdieria sulphuraria]